MFLYLSLGFSQERSLEAEYWAMWSFGLMQLFLFAPLAAAKTLNPTASQKASQRMLWADMWSSSRLPRLPAHSGKCHSYTALCQGHLLRNEG